MTRRDLVRWTALAAASSPAALAALGSSAAAAADGDVVPVNLELVTLTEDRAIITWTTGRAGPRDELGRLPPVPADAEVRWGTSPTALDRTASSGRTDTPYHVVELTDLEPGRTYWYEARSGGRTATPTKFSLIEGNAVSTAPGQAAPDGPHAFTVPQPPKGRFLFSIVLCNDLHIGETVAGRSGSVAALAGVSQVPGHPPYPEVMFRSLVRDAQRLGAHAMVVAGDLTAEAEPHELTTARRLLDRFGERNQAWWVARGNHDRAHDGTAYAGCSLGRWGGRDCFADHFFPSAEPTYFADELLGLRILGLDTYDRSGTGGEAGLLGRQELAWLEEELARDRDQPTMVFGHHPLVVEGSPYPTPPGSALDATQAEALVERYRSTPGVFLHHAGHTHRNKLTRLGGAPGVVHQEVAAVKEYPGGFTLLRIHEGGYALNFHKASSDEARAWNERSRTQVGGTWPQFALGSRVSDRNLVVDHDLSDLRAPAVPEAPVRGLKYPHGDGGSDGPSGVELAVIGGAGVALVAAAAGGLVALRRRGDRLAPPDDDET